MSPLPRHLLRDEPLARLAADGDGSAFEVLFARYRTALLRCSRSIVRNDHDAQDVVQSTALKALSGLARRRDGVPFRPWLFRIAYNEAISVLRLRRARPAQELELTIAHPEPGPAQQVLDRADLRALIDDLTHLTEGQRTALLLRQLNGSSYDEIARVLDTTPIAARRSVSTARGNLAAFAEGRDAGCAGIQLTLAAGDRRAMRALAVRAHLRSCSACRARAARPVRGARAAAFVPVGVWELLGGLRAVLTPAGASLSDGAGVPVAKALAVAVAVTASAGAGSLHRHHHHAARASTQVAAAPAHVAARVHHAHVHHHAASAPAVHVAAAPAVHAATAPAVHAIATHVSHGSAGVHRSYAAYSPPVPVAHHAPPAEPEPAPQAGSPPVADDSPATAPSPRDCHPEASGPASPAHTDSSQVGPHNEPPGPLT